MSTTRKARRDALAVAGSAVLALPLGLAAPADATTTKDGCTVTPREREF